MSFSKMTTAPGELPNRSGYAGGSKLDQTTHDVKGLIRKETKLGVKSGQS
jgi:hypothetical protein